MRKILICFIWLVTWRAEWYEAQPCALLIDPWTNEPAAKQPDIQCGDTKYKYIVRSFETRSDAADFIKTRPADTATFNIKNLSVFEYIGK